MSRLETPGLAAGSNRIVRSLSVTADLIFLAIEVGVVEQVHDPGLRRGRLAHLGRRVLQVADLRRGLDDVGLGHPQGRPVARVEPLGQVAGQLEVLALVLTDGHLVRGVEQDVGRLQDRVGEQPDRGPVTALLGRLVLELGHPRGLAEAGEAGEHPLQLRVLGHLALHEQDRTVGVDAAGDVLRGGPPGALAQQLRGHLDGDRVQVDHAVRRVVGLLHAPPTARARRGSCRDAGSRRSVACLRTGVAAQSLRTCPPLCQGRRDPASSTKG